MNKQEYIEAIIKTALANGMTKTQILEADPQELAKAHLHAQIQSVEKAAAQVIAEVRAEFF